MPQSATETGNLERMNSTPRVSTQNRKDEAKSKSNQQGSSAAPRGAKGAVGRDNRGRAICVYLQPIGMWRRACRWCMQERTPCLFQSQLLQAAQFSGQKDEMPKTGLTWSCVGKFHSA